MKKKPTDPKDFLRKHIVVLGATKADKEKLREALIDAILQPDQEPTPIAKRLMRREPEGDAA